MKRMKRLGMLLAAMLLVQSCMIPAAVALDADTYSQEEPYFEMELQDDADDPQYWSEMHRGDMDNIQVQAAGVDHSCFTPRTLKSGETLRKGIDVSQFQGQIDWSAVKAGGIDFAFIRVGYRGWGTGKLSEDNWVYENLKGAIDNGIQVGVYIYSQATTVAEAKEEAQYVLTRIKDYAVTLPVVIDFEYAEYPSTGRLTGRLYQAKLSKSDATAVCNAFLREVSAAGYRGAVYANKTMLEKQLNAGKLEGAIWLAHYASSTDYSGSYEFWQCTASGYVEGIPSQNVDLDYWFDPGVSELPFWDVLANRWSYQDILQAYQRGIVSGTETNQFEPTAITTRGQLAAMLYRLSGSPKVTGSSTFTDLTMDYYRDAITWAQQNKVIYGVGGTRFAPDQGITREDLVAMLYRLSGSPKNKSTLSGFKDIDRISGYAKDAVTWAVENGILAGDAGRIMPQSYATREQAVAILMRYARYAEM